MGRNLSFEKAKELTNLEIENYKLAINLVEPIKGVITEFDKKKLTKRIDTKLSEIDPNLQFKMDEGRVYIELFLDKKSIKDVDYMDREVSVDLDFSYIILLNARLTDGNRSILNDDALSRGLERLDAEKANRILDTKREVFTDRVNELDMQVKSAKELLAEYDRLRKQVLSFKQRIDYSIARNFDMDGFTGVY